MALVGRILAGASVLLFCGSTPAGTAPVNTAAKAGIPPTIRQKAACFVMGARRNYSVERPPHRVCLSAHALDRHEVTVRRYARCVAARRCPKPVAYDKSHPTQRRCNWGRGGHDAHPINCVTWRGASQYCAWTGGRLPTEAEWEHAARSSRGDTRRRTGASCTLAVLASATHPVRLGCGAGGTRRVGTSPGDRSHAGVEDLTGNVSEWVGDWFSLGYYRRSPAKDPRGPKRGRAHAVRGCSFQCVPGSRLLAPTTRGFAATWDPTIGFRCARSRR